MHTTPPAISMKAAREEAEMVLYEGVEEPLARSRLKPRQVSADPQHAGHPLSAETPCLMDSASWSFKLGIFSLAN